jgi:hypothetical protein
LRGFQFQPPGQFIEEERGADRAAALLQKMLDPALGGLLYGGGAAGTYIEHVQFSGKQVVGGTGEARYLGATLELGPGSVPALTGHHHGVGDPSPKLL